MPFFLVTHTSLVEAEDEQSAAQKVIDELRDGRQVTVAVKTDELTVRHLTVEAKPDVENVLDDDCNGVASLPEGLPSPDPVGRSERDARKSNDRRISGALLSVGLCSFAVGAMMGLTIMFTLVWY